VGPMGPRGMPKAMSDELRMGCGGSRWRDEAGEGEGQGGRPEEVHLSGPLVMQSAPWGPRGVRGKWAEGAPRFGGAGVGGRVRVHLLAMRVRT